MKSRLPRILVLAPIPAAALDRLRDRFDLVEAWQDPMRFLDSDRRASDTEIVFTIGNRPLTRAMVERLPALRYVCHYGVGHDQLDLVALRERGVLVTNTAGASASCVADLAVAMLVACVRRLPRGDRFVREGRWRERDARLGLTPPLGGRKVGIFGLGEIGRRIATRAAAFEMEVGYHARGPKPGVAWLYFATLISLAAWADDLVVAASATPETAGSVDGAVLAALGPGYLINVARGSIVDEDALVAALRASVIAGAGLDTFANEPAIRSEFLELDTIVLSPHAAAGTHRAMQETTEIFLSNLELYVSGHKPQNVVR